VLDFRPKCCIFGRKFFDKNKMLRQAKIRGGGQLPAAPPCHDGTENERASIGCSLSHNSVVRAWCVQDLGVHCELSDAGYWQLSLFSPYWMINKTSRDLTYRVPRNSLLSISANCVSFVNAVVIYRLVRSPLRYNCTESV